MSTNRFFPGPSGNGAIVVVPMTDNFLVEVDGYHMTNEARQEIIQTTGELRRHLIQHSFAAGNKVSTEAKMRPFDPDFDEDKNCVHIELYGGPSLRGARYTLQIPITPAIAEKNPRTYEEVLAIIGRTKIGGNTANVRKSLQMLMAANIGPDEYHVFCPPDTHLEAWLQGKLNDEQNAHFIEHSLGSMKQRFGLALPYNDSGNMQEFSFNKPQESTVDPMKQYAELLRGLDHIVVSESLMSVLEGGNINTKQIHNPTNALHQDSALTSLKRKNTAGHWIDIPVINTGEMETWIKTMENRQYDIKESEIADVKFPMPFRNNGQNIDSNAVEIMQKSHARFMNLGATQPTDHINLETSIGCGPEGGQNHFQCDDTHYVAAASTPTKDGAVKLINLCGQSHERNVQPEIIDAVGAGDAAFTAGLIHRFYAPIEDIVRTAQPGFSTERIRIAAMAFTTILQRVFGELVFHSKERDLSGVPTQAFPILFDKVLQKALAAAEKTTSIDKVPTNVYFDEEWGLSFMVMEIQRNLQA